MAAAIIFFAIGGAVLIYAGLTANRTVVASDDPEAYLRSLDYDYEETDEFQQLLAEPFLRRVLRPLGSAALGSIAQLLPTNYRDGIRQKLVFAGLAGRYRPEEIITAQVLLAAVGLVLALGYGLLLEPSTGIA